MSNIFNISHPLNDEPGMSQRRRLSPALDATQNLIDARDLADMLVYIHQFSKQVNFYDFSLEVSNWSVFFEKSPPFILAKLARQNTEGSIKAFQQYNNLVKNDPTAANFQLLLDFTYRTTLLDVADLYADTKSVGGFQTALVQEISSRDMTAAIRQFIGIANALQYCLGGSSKDFTFLTEDAIWQLDITDIFAQSTPSVALSPRNDGVKMDEKQMILTWQQGIERIFAHFQLVLNRLSVAAEQHLSESLYPLEVEFKERHEPHLGLLFAFLELFKHLKGQLNGMTAKHLDFYFRQVLKIQSRKAIPDAVHLVLEVQKHVQRQLLKRGVDFRDGKDINGQDILFSLDDEVVINKAQIKSLKTLFVKTRLAKPVVQKIVATKTLDVAQNEENNTEFVENALENATKMANCDPSATVLETYTEGVFIAPVANSADGKGMDFKEPMSKNWATLGRDKSKFVPKIIDGNLEPDNNLFARLGFILASPVLFLQEGVRTITIDLTLTDLPVGWYLSNIFLLNNQQPFKIYLSGEKEWIKIEKYTLNIQEQTLRFIIILDATVEPIVHFNPENLKENYGTTEPLVKFEINQEAKIDIDTLEYQPCCCAERTISKDTIKVSAYHFLKNISVTDVKISVQVCGIKKNIIVQNDENLQDVNGLIYPFGTRPNVPDFSIVNLANESENIVIPYGKTDGSNFYIGSKEIFLKKWQQVNINLSWKDKPADFKAHYGAYLKRTNDGKDAKNDFTKFGLDEKKFKFNASYLSEGAWYREPENQEPPEEEPYGKKLFESTQSETIVKNEIICTEQVGAYEYRLVFQPLTTFTPTNKHDLTLPFTKLEANTRNGFVKLTLKGQDFLHNDYPFVLARQMMAFGRFPEGVVNGAVYMVAEIPQVIDFSRFVQEIRDLVVDPKTLEKVPEDFDAFLKKITDIIVRADDGSKSASEIKIAEIKKLFDDKKDESINTTLHNFMAQIRNIIKRADDVKADWATKFNEIKAEFAGTTDEGVVTHLNTFMEQIRDIIKRADVMKANLEVKFTEIQNAYSAKTDDEIKNNLTAFTTQIRDIIKKADIMEANLDIKFNEIKAAFEGANDENAEDDVNKFLSKIRDIIKRDDVMIPHSDLKFEEIVNLFKGDADEVIETAISTFMSDIKAIIKRNDTQKSALEKKYEQIKAIFDGQDDEIIKKEVKDLATLTVKQNTLLKKIGVGKDGQKALIPNEPWTPIIKNISLDYAAEAQKEDVAFVHLYPFEATYKKESIISEQEAAKADLPLATLLPQFLDEGTLFLGFEQLEPSTNVQILFQLAEATADTEGGRADVKWHYLSKNNEWKPLRTGFEILEDTTNGLTASGIIKLAIPEDIGDKNIDNQSITQMPSGQFWLKAASVNNTRAVCETLGVFTQAVRATARFTEGSDTTRLNTPIAAESVAKLAVADASIKQVTQPFDTFGGQIEEAGNTFYLRVSERLRHKGRAATTFDYERLLLEAFPVIYKAKCIPHSLALPANQFQVDLQQAAGFVTVAVIPDLTRLKSGNLTEPRVALHVLDQITAYLKHRTTPFAHLKVVNPRYEAVDICFDLKLKKGKDALYYSRQLEEELRLFLAPWSVGDTDKLSFGQPIYYSDILTFIDQRDYVDYVKCLAVDLAEKPRCPLPNPQTDPSVNVVKIGNNAPENGILRPLTPRSVLIAGKIAIKVL